MIMLQRYFSATDNNPIYVSLHYQIKQVRMYSKDSPALDRSEKRGLMTTKELIDYLDACFDAEEGLYESEKMAELLAQKMHYIQTRSYTFPLPEKAPELEDLEPDRRDYHRKQVQSLNEDIRMFMKRLEFDHARRFKELLELEQQRLQQAEIDYPALCARNQERIRKFEAEKEAYEERSRIYNSQLQAADAALIRVLEEERTNCLKEANAFRYAREKLYENGLLHERFRNISAISQLREYLDMGVADQLTGADGAYRVYLEDLRTEKIVGSVDELRQSVERGMSQLIKGQKAIYSKLVQINDNLQILNTTVDRGLNRLGETLSQGMSEINTSINRSTDAVLSRMGSMEAIQNDLRETIRRSAYNQYIIDRQNNLGNYLFYRMRDPLT